MFCLFSLFVVVIVELYQKVIWISIAIVIVVLITILISIAIAIFWSELTVWQQQQQQTMIRWTTHSTYRLCSISITISIVIAIWIERK